MSVTFINGNAGQINASWYRALDIAFLYRQEDDGSVSPILDKRLYRANVSRPTRLLGRGIVEFGGDDTTLAGGGQSISETQIGHAGIVEFTLPPSGAFCFFAFEKVPVILSIQEIKNVSAGTNTVNIQTINGSPGNFLVPTGTQISFNNNLNGNVPSYPFPLLFLGDASSVVGSGIVPTFIFSVSTAEQIDLKGNSMMLIGASKGLSFGTSNFSGESLEFVNQSSASSATLRVQYRAYRIPSASN